MTSDPPGSAELQLLLPGAAGPCVAAHTQGSQGKPSLVLEMSGLFREPISLCLRLGVWVGEETCIRVRDSARAPFLLVGVLLPIQAKRTSPGTLLGLLRDVVLDRVISACC